ncbi:Translation elongation factor 1 beta [Brettanomyces bruxellensis]|uniref:Translation elongation factor 1 beta n=1 Tax=Dekkera bruxellensis TaxID=5007 RepID=A0A8H6EQQ8_DEKBR|nr:Translation elongation factor 1 beta [Brettanomyces bruxellensis]
MSFTDFSSIDTLTKLDKFLEDKSYVEGTSATQADVTTYKAFQKAYPSFTRWFNHIASFTEEFETLPAGKAPAAAADEDDDDVDLFDDDEEEDAEAEKLKAERVAAYQAKKAGKPKAAAKSLVTVDIKPWDDETDLEAMLKFVKSIKMDGLVWGSHSFVDVGFGIKKLQINVVVEDDKVSVEDDVKEKVEEDGEEWVQSVDIVAMAKL